MSTSDFVVPGCPVSAAATARVCAPAPAPLPVVAAFINVSNVSLADDLWAEDTLMKVQDVGVPWTMVLMGLMGLAINSIAFNSMRKKRRRQKTKFLGLMMVREVFLKLRVLKTFLGCLLINHHYICVIR